MRSTFSNLQQTRTGSLKFSKFRSQAWLESLAAQARRGFEALSNLQDSAVLYMIVLLLYVVTKFRSWYLYRT